MLATAACSFSGAPTQSGPDAGVSDDANIDAPPQGTVTVSFQDGVNAYAGTRDTYISADEPDAGHGGLDVVRIDTRDQSGSPQWGLLRFTEIFESEGGPIPDSAEIVSANLVISIDNEGNSVEFHNALVSWTELSFWSQFAAVDALPMSDVHFSAVTIAATEFLAEGLVTLSVPESLRGWAIDPVSRLGWFIEPKGANAAYFQSRESDASRVNRRPKLRVMYRPTE